MSSSADFPEMPDKSEDSEDEFVFEDSIRISNVLSSDVHNSIKERTELEMPVISEDESIFEDSISISNILSSPDVQNSFEERSEIGQYTKTDDSFVVTTHRKKTVPIVSDSSDDEDAEDPSVAGQYTRTDDVATHRKKTPIIESDSSDDEYAEGPTVAVYTTDTESSDASLHSLYDDKSNLILESKLLNGFEKRNDEQVFAARKVQSIIVRRSPSLVSNIADDDVDIIDISTDDEPVEVTTKKIPKVVVHQSTLDETLFGKPINYGGNPLIIKQENVKSNKIIVSLDEYEDQKNLVVTLQADVLKSRNLLRTLNLKELPDEGKMLIDRHENLTKNIKMAEEKLLKMEVNTDMSPSTSKVKQASWEDLEVACAVVKPKTFGTQAMATYNAQKALTMERLENLHGSLKNCPTEDMYETDPKGLRVELMPHQKHALAWLLWRESQKPSGGILADDMGLGKTLTMISLMLKTKEIKENDINNFREAKDKHSNFQGGTLVVCPASLLRQWESELKKRTRRGLASVELYHGPKRETIAKSLSQFDMVITTYAICMNEYQRNTALYRIHWRRVVLDEAHQVRNHKSQTSEAVCQLTAKSRWALTGTPIHNKELDIYALLKFLRCTPFDDLAVWKRWVTNKNTGGQKRLHTVISSILLRRTKAQLEEKGVLNCLPERNWSLIEVSLEKNEMQVYQKVLILSRTLFAQFLHQRAEKDTDALVLNAPKFTVRYDPNSEYYKMHQKLVRINRVKEVKQHEILMLLQRLRQICCHPSLITGMLQGEITLETDEEDVDINEMNVLEQLNNLNLNDEPSEENNVELPEISKGGLNPSDPIFDKDRKSSKIYSVLQILREKILPTNDKAIVVSQWTSFLKLIALHLKDEGIIYEQLDGSVNVQKRSVLVENFNNPLHSTRVLLLSLTAGGVGLNLVGGNHLFLMDIHWNPQLEMQAQDRIYRVGQQKPVNIYKFVAVDTIEQRIKSLQDYKLSISDAMLTGAKITQTKLSLEDLKMLFSM